MRVCLFLVILFSFRLSYAQSSGDTVQLLLDLPVLDFPHQSYASRTTGNFFAGYANPSMKQSLQMSTNFYNIVHHDIKRLFRKVNNNFLRNLLTYGGVTAVDLLSAYVPFGHAWLHEEYHRAVLTRREVNSANEVNTFPFGKSAIKVYRITDEDLRRMHDNHQNDWRRLQTAGGESELHLIQTLQRNDFFYKQKMPNIPLYWILTFGVGEYLRACARPDIDEINDKLSQEEGSDIANRDFTGPDYTAWAYSLFRPNLPYSARGIHPSGVGVNRYIRQADLTQEERDFIRKQGAWQWINFVSPTLFGIERIRLKSSAEGDHYGNFALRSIAIPYGNDFMIDLWYQSPKINAFAVVHSYFNKDSYFPGLEAGVVDYKLWNNKIALSPSAALWLQPKNLSFTEKSGELGGMLRVKVRANGKTFCPYIELQGKTAGWLMGDVFLEPNLSVNAGVNLLVRN
ncbi:hypothetical protein [Rhodoflexus sp.]